MSKSPVPPDTPPPGDPAAALELLDAAVDALVGADPTRATVPELGDLLVRLQTRIDALGGAASEWTMAFESAGGPEDAGSATLAAWMRQRLRLTGREARRRTRAGHALRALASTREAMATGLIGASHLDAIAHGVHQLGPEVMAGAEPIILDVAAVCDADAVKRAITKLRDTLDPDAADAAYLHALEKRDVTVSAVGDGYAVGGFLDPETGAMFSQVLYSGAKPDNQDDARTSGQRRVDALRDICRSILDHGLPSDRGLRPHLYVTVTADRLHTATGPAPDRRSASGNGAGPDTRLAQHAHQPALLHGYGPIPDTRLAEQAQQPALLHGYRPIPDTLLAEQAQQPALLHGYGPIPDTLLGKLACDADTTLITLDRPGPYPTVLDVGRTARLATLKQRHAVITAQAGVCFNPGCDRTHLEIHHLIPWSLGGPTDLANLRGYCTRCHHLIHLGHLIVKPDPDGDGGWTHHTKHGRRLIDHRRRQHRRTHRWTTALLAGGLDHANDAVMQSRPGQPRETPRLGRDPTSFDP